MFASIVSVYFSWIQEPCGKMYIRSKNMYDRGKKSLEAWKVCESVICHKLSLYQLLLWIILTEWGISNFNDIIYNFVLFCHNSIYKIFSHDYEEVESIPYMSIRIFIHIPLRGQKLLKCTLPGQKKIFLIQTLNSMLKNVNTALNNTKYRFWHLFHEVVQYVNC